MANEKRTILLTNALRKRQTLKERITKATEHSLVIGVVKRTSGEPTSTSLKTREEQETYIKGSMQKVVDLRDEYYALVAGINKANIENTITIAGKEVSLATAIEMRNSFGLTYGGLLNHVSKTIKASTRHIERTDEDIEKVIANEVTRSIAGTDDTAQRLEIENQTRERVERRMKEELQDPLDAQNLLQTLKEQYEDIRDELETKLNIANATISFEY